MERIHSDEGIKKLLDLLGRINQVKKSERIETVTHSYIQKSPIIDT